MTPYAPTAPRFRLLNSPTAIPLYLSPYYVLPERPMSYPLFYDPLYYPELYPELFEDADALSRWLNRSLRSHVASCPLHRTPCLHDIQAIVDDERSTFGL
ncbi:hypothetical protein FA13DRAFT_1737445, partial [Coprinellus micaceus]